MRFWPFRRKKNTAKPPAGIENLLPPEGVPLQFTIAGVGVRLSAQITDIALTAVAAVAIVILLLIAEITAPDTLGAIASMLFFVIRIPYYVVSELLWNGQTLGKRMMKIKVISADGGSLEPNALVVRNLMKEAEIFLPGTLLFTLDQASPVSSMIAAAWVIGVLAVPLLNRRRQRLGDLIAGTFVIHLPVPILLPDVAVDAPTSKAPKDPFSFLTHHLDHYGAFELQTLEDLLRAGKSKLGHAALRKRRASLAAVVEQIRRKIDYADQIGDEDHEAFLSAFYNAQRAYLEQRQLFGERRADKKHAEKIEEEPKK